MATNINLNEGHFFVSVDGNRLRQHDGNTVYLENGREFQLEVFNPTTSKVLAKIKINGNYISTSGLVLKPGQRVFLERYFDKAQKFKFETYSVDNSPETAGAIANNGVVEVEFFKEYIAPQPVYIPPYNPYWCNNIFYSSGTGSACLGTTLGGNSTFTSSNFGGTVTNTSYVGGSINVNASSYSNGDNYKSMSTNNASPENRSMLKSKLSKETLSDVGAMDFMSMEFERSVAPTPEKKETGRVEAGSYSNQSFVTDYATYNSWVSSRVMWKILPLSQKPIEASEVKNYCDECGYRIRKSSFKFCPQCGNNLK